MPKYDLFLSYRHHSDKDHIGRFAEAMRHYQHKIFLDSESIREFESISGKINAAIPASSCFLIWYSSEYLGSIACGMELARILAACSGDNFDRIMIVNPDPDADHIVPSRLRGARMFMPSLRDEAWPALLAKAIHQHLNNLAGELCLDAIMATPDEFGQPPAVPYDEMLSSRHAEVFKMFDAFHIKSSIDVNRRMEHGRLLVYGPTGIGKAHLVQTYYQYFAQMYIGGIFWFSLSGVESMQDVLLSLHDQTVNIMAQLDLELAPLDQEGSFETRYVRSIKHNLSRISAKIPRGKDYLWVVEDIPSSILDSIAWFKAPTTLGRTIYSSDMSAMDPEIVAIRVPALELDDIRYIFDRAIRDRFGDSDYLRILTISRGMLSVIRRLVAEIRSFGFSTTVGCYDKNRNEQDEVVDSYGRLLGICSNEETDLIAALANFAPTSVSFEVLKHLVERLSVVGKPEDAARTLRIMAVLSGRGLARVSSVKGIMLEPAVRALVRTGAVSVNAELGRRSAIITLNELMPKTTRSRLNKSLTDLAMHARQLARDANSEETAILLQRWGTHCALIGDLSSERLAFRGAYSWFSEAFGPNDPRTIEAFLELASCYRGGAAVKMSESAMGMIDSLAPGDRLRLRALHSRSIYLDEAGEHTRALEIILEARRLAEQAPSRSDSLGIMIDASYALILHHLHRDEESLGEMEKCYSRAVEHLPEDDGDRIRIAANLGSMLFQNRQYRRGYEVANMVLDMQLKKYGNRHPNVSWAAMSCLGATMEFDEWDKARMIFVKHLAWMFFRRGLLNRTNVAVRQQIADVHADMVRQYANPRFWHKRPKSLQASLERSMFLVMVEYAVRGANTRNYYMLFGEFLWACRKHSMTRFDFAIRRMIERMKAARPASVEVMQTQEAKRCRREVANWENGGAWWNIFRRRRRVTTRPI